MKEVSTRSAVSGFRKTLYAGIATGVLLLLVEGVASVLVAVRDLPPPPVDGFAEHVSLCEHDPDLGWRYVADLRVDDYGRPGGTFTTDGAGRRIDATATAPAAGTTKRIVLLGDSFTAGHGVSDEETFAARLDGRMQSVEVSNLAVEGYGVDQAYLRFLREGQDLDADLVVLCFIEDDFRRMVTDRFIDRYPKPLLRVDGDRLLVTNLPVPRRSAVSQAASDLRRFVDRLSIAKIVPRAHARDDGADAWRVAAEAALADLARRLRERGRRLALVHLPTFSELFKPDSPALKWLETFSKDHDTPLLDLRGPIRRLPPDERKACYRLAEKDGHFTPQGHERVAGLLQGWLASLLPGGSSAEPLGAAPR